MPFLRICRLCVPLVLCLTATGAVITPESVEEASSWRDAPELPAARIEDYDPVGPNIAWQLDNLDIDDPVEGLLEGMGPIYGGYALPETQTTGFTTITDPTDPEKAWIAYLRANMLAFGLLAPDPVPEISPVIVLGPPAFALSASASASDVPEMSPGAALALGCGLLALFRMRR
ncbi:MAG: hypothetical protein FJW30_13955 [Acidobacteria bacterium]|nr:hypothetical protein [Acidobacteriota bacterium]